MVWHPFYGLAMVKKLKYFILLSTLAATVAGFTFIKKGGGNGIKIVVIDPGHGGKDPGCSGAVHNEKDVALAVALKLGKLIEDNLKDVKVIYTRTTDVFVELEDRAQIANKAKADLFISIHCNAAGKAVMIKDKKTGKVRVKTFKNKKGKVVVVEKPNPIPFGTETYVMGLKNEEGKMKVATRENSAIFYEDDYEKKYGGFDPESEESYIIMSNYTSAYVIQSASLAMKIQDEYTKKSGRIDKGVHRQSIWVLWRTSMPSILTELGYLTNPLEETFLGSAKGQDYLAKALFRGLRRYKDEVEGKKKEYNDEFENQEPLENENILAGNIPGQKKATDEVEEEVDKPIESEKKEPEQVEEKIVPPLKKELVEKANDTLDIKIDFKPKDTTLPFTQAKEDTLKTAKELAEKIKKNKALEEKKKEEPKIDVKDEVKQIAELIFKVQFASSDVSLNLKQEKYAAVIDAAFYKMKNIFKYTSGNFTNFKDATAHQNFLRKKGFTDCFVIALKNGERMDVNEARKLLGQ
jgi:N-acetylmuramoyl-L-alanine amidase